MEAVEQQNQQAQNQSDAGYQFYPRARKWKQYIYELIGSYISQATRYYDHVIQLHPRQEDTGYLFDAIDCPHKSVVAQGQELPSLRLDKSNRTMVLINGNFNHDLNIQKTLQDLKPSLSRTTRLSVVLYNPYFRSLYQWANALGLRDGEQPSTFVTRGDLLN
ncbi:MAG: hypothetical protein KDD62_06295, partial [Bdellovibrionales bacterium]|nr:hypothetical protein [Bdellovibrionales bacterium]